MTASGPAALTDVETERLTRRGLRLTQFTVAYNVAEGAVAITSGVTGWAGLAGRLRHGLRDRVRVGGAGGPAVVRSPASRRGRRSQGAPPL